MRQRFEQQMSLCTKAIQDIKIPLKSRDELPAVVKALQHIFITAELNEKVFLLLENKISKGKKKTGRNGMDLWHILVLAVVRHSVDTNWDRLEMMANYDIFVRQIMGVHCTGFLSEEEKIEFSYQTILDNVRLVDEALLSEINQLVVEAGHQLLKKKEKQEAFRLKTNSYALETNVHFPTDLNLLWDSSRKCLDVVESLLKLTPLSGWRKIKHIYSTLKSQFCKTSHQVFKGKSDVQKKQHVKEYIKQSTQLLKRCEELIEHPPVFEEGGLKIAILLIELQRYCEFLKKFTNQIERRLIKEETIPAEEKIFSIFEEHTEWITKGKLNKKVELGHLILITTDQHQFIVDYKIMEKQKDASQITDLTERLKKKFAGKTTFSHSFDKGFYSKANFELLEQSGIQHVVLPKKEGLTKKIKRGKVIKPLRNCVMHIVPLKAISTCWSTMD